MAVEAELPHILQEEVVEVELLQGVVVVEVELPHILQEEVAVVELP